MKKTFTKSYIMAHRGCCPKWEISQLSFINDKPITIETILASEARLQDKAWFVVEDCALTAKQQRKIAYGLALMVLPIFERKYPNEKCIGKVLKAIKDYESDRITRKQLKDAVIAAHEIITTTYSNVAWAVTDLAWAATDVARAVIRGTGICILHTRAAHFAALAAKSNRVYQKKILKHLKDFVKNN